MFSLVLSLTESRRWLPPVNSQVTGSFDDVSDTSSLYFTLSNTCADTLPSLAVEIVRPLRTWTDSASPPRLEANISSPSTTHHLPCLYCRTTPMFNNNGTWTAVKNLPWGEKITYKVSPPELSLCTPRPPLPRSAPPHG